MPDRHDTDEDPFMQSVRKAYDEYIDSRDEREVQILRARANLAEAIQIARRYGVSLPKQAEALGIDRTWLFRLARGGLMPPPSKPPKKMSRVQEGLLLGNTRSDWQAQVEGISVEEVLNAPPPEAPDIQETVIVPKIPNCRYCNTKATRAIQYGNGKTTMVCDIHAPEWKGSETE